MARWKAIAALGLAVGAVGAVGAGVVAATAGDHEGRDASAAVRAAGGQGVTDVIGLGPTTLRVGHGARGDVAVLTGLPGLAPKGAAEQSLGLGCPELVGEAVRLCGGTQQEGERSVFIGRVAAGLTVRAAFPGDARGAVHQSGGYFVAIGPLPRAGVLGLAPVDVIAVDGTGAEVGRFASHANGS